MENPISTNINSITLISDNNTDNDNYNIEIFSKNIYCQFERLELEESVNNVFPTGALLIRDLGDIVTYIAKNKIKKFKIGLGATDQDGNSLESYTWYITSVTYVNNMASETDQAFIALYFTNKLFFESQSASFYNERPELDEDGVPIPETNTLIWPQQYPFVTTPSHIIEMYGRKRVFSGPESISNGQAPDPNAGCGVNRFIHNTVQPTNYVMFRPRISDAMRREQFQTNIITYLNYVFTYAIDDTNRPLYMFWTDFSNCLNYKFFQLRTDLEDGGYSFDHPDTDPRKIQAYCIYDSNDYERVFEIEGSEVNCRKIYTLVTNPAYSLMDKNYYYIRSVPMFMEDTSDVPGGTFSDVYHLMSPFLSDGSNMTLSTVTSYTTNDSPGPTYSQRILEASSKDQNLVFLPDKGYQGYLKDFDGTRLAINSVDAVGAYQNLIAEIESTPLGLRDTYNENYAQPPLYGFNDNMYMLQYPYDITINHPNRKKSSDQAGATLISVDFAKEVNDILNEPIPSSGDVTNDLIFNNILNDVTINKVLQAKYKAMKIQEKYDNERRELLVKTEKENFVSHVLCCIGKELKSEDWFFAQITGFVKDERKIIGNNGQVLVDKLNDAWLYSWTQLEPGPVIAGLTAGNTANIPIHASQHSMFHGWTSSNCVGSTGSPSDTDIQNLALGIGFTGIETWAINLNERLNGMEPSSSGMINYRGPGFNETNIDQFGSFSVKPIGFTGAAYANELKGGAKHIVKMYQISLTELRDMGLCVPAPNLANEYVYYFTAENAVDGDCNV
jgi:hypothetical protein